MADKKVIVAAIVLVLVCFAASAEIMTEYYLMDGVLISVDEPYYIEGYPEDQTYFFISGDTGYAADVFVLYDQGGNLGPLDAMLVMSRMFNLQHYTAEYAGREGEVYSIFQDTSRSDIKGYIMFAGVGGEGFFAYGIDLTGSPGGQVLGLLLLAMPGEGDEGIRDIVEHLSVEFMDAAG